MDRRRGEPTTTDGYLGTFVDYVQGGRGIPDLLRRHRPERLKGHAPVAGTEVATTEGRPVPLRPPRVTYRESPS